MTAMNIVHMRVKPGREADYIANHRNAAQFDMPGIRRAWVVKSLDGMRDMLEDLGGGRGVTEPYSGEVTVEIGR